MKKIKKIVHHLRSQPEETRTQILHTLMLFFAVILFVTWTVSFANRVSSEDEISSENPISEFADRMVEIGGDASWPSSVNYADTNISE